MIFSDFNFVGTIGHFFPLYAFAQLTYRESLRDIETCLRALQKTLFHANLRNTVWGCARRCALRCPVFEMAGYR
jgi:hypothetical protein